MILDHNKGGSYFATTDTQGYYKIDHVPFGNYNVFVCNNEAEMHAGDGILVNSISSDRLESKRRRRLAVKFG